MEEECLVEETSFNYDKSENVVDKDYEQTPKRPGTKTKKALGKLLEKIDFSGRDSNEDDVFLDVSLELSSPLKNLVVISVKKSFALDIDLNKVVRKFSYKKLVMIRKLFSKVNGFGEVSILSKFSRIIHVSFTSESSLAQATEKARAANILVNTDLKKSIDHSDWTVVVKEIPVGTSAKAVHTALSEFGSVVLIKMQLIGLWQKAVVEFVQLNQADLVTDRWSILIRKDAVRVAKTNANKKSWDTRDQHRTLLYTLPIGTNAYDIWNFIGSVGGKTCVINQHSVIYAWARCAVVCFNFVASINAVMGTTSVLKGVNLCWFYLNSAKYNKCGNLGHISLNCFVNKSRLASIYARHSAPISYLVSFGGVLWTNIVGGSLFSLLLMHNVLAAFGSFSEIKPTPMVSLELNNRFAALECSLASLAECVDKLAKRLNSPGPMVSQSSIGCQPLVTSSSQNQEIDIVISEGSGMATGGKAIARVVVFNSSVITKIEETLNNFSITVMEFLAKIDNAGLVPTEDIIMNKFDEIRVFSFGLDKRFLSTEMAIIMNNYLAHHVSKIKEIPGHFVSVQLLFKNKLSVVFLGLYTGASVETRFGQACGINSLIAKTANSFIFMVLNGDFNEDGDKKSASFKFCLDLGLVNSFSDAKKVIDYIFVNKSLSSALAGHKVTPVYDFFNTDYNAMLVSVGLGGLLNVYLNSEHKQANKDKWKFKIKNANANKWAQFREHSLVKFVEHIDMFNDIKVVTSSANSVFFKYWFSEFNCLKNKQSSKFFKLELLIAKLKASKVCTMFDNSESRKSILLYLLEIKKLYHKSKYYESKMAKDISIKKVINRHMETFSSNKGHMIKSVLDWPFKKVVLDHLIVDNELILEPKEIKSAVDDIMKGWTRKWVTPISLSIYWSNQYALLNYVGNSTFSNIIDVIKSDEFLLVVKDLPDGKTHGNAKILDGLLDVFNVCLKLGVVPLQPIALVKTARKILSKIFSDRISLIYSKFNVLCDNNFSVLKGMSTQTPIFTIGFIIENALEKNKKMWLVLQDMRKAYDSVGWPHLRNSLTNWVITDFGLTDGYIVYNKLDQGEVFSPLLWRIFYDSLLCKVKKHEQLCEYRLDSKYFTKTGKADPKSGKTFFFAAGAFVDDTIWIGNCLVATQHILDIANNFFMVNDIAINTDKMVAILINQGARKASLFISGSKISIAKKDDLMKAHSDVKFFSNVVLKKAITKKQFLYLVSAVLQFIIRYRLQFSCVSKSVCEKAMELQAASWMSWHPLKFPIKLLINPANCFLAGTTCVFKLCNFSLDSDLPDVFRARNSVLVLNVLSVKSYLCIVKSLKDMWKKLDSKGPVSVWFASLVKFIIGSGLSNSVLLFSCSVLTDSPCDFDYIGEHLLNSRLGSITVYTDSLVKDLGSLSAHGGATTYFPDVNTSVGVKVNGLLLSILVEMQTIALALKCVSTSRLVILYINSQASLDLCKFTSDVAGFDFHDKCWIEKKHIYCIIAKKIYHFGVVGNKRADFYADAAVTSKFFLSIVILYHFLVIEGRLVSENAYHVAKKLFNAIYSVGWKTKCVSSIIGAGLSNHFDKARTFCIWHPDGRIKSGYTSTASVTLWSYFIKTFHHQLSVAKRKKMYNSSYSSVACIWCGLVEDSDHVFSCSHNINVRNILLFNATLEWNVLLSAFANGNAVTNSLNEAASSIDLFTALAKSFVLK
ncbi:hypothetical protein G9A89_007601, partial [Geosiphon pyriformis]